MPWFKAKERIRLTANETVETGERFEYPRRAGLTLVAQNRADWSVPPYASTGSSSESGDETPLESVDWTDIDGIGPSTAKAIEAAIEATFPDVETIGALLDEELTELGGVGPSTAEDLRSYLEEL